MDDKFEILDGNWMLQVFPSTEAGKISNFLVYQKDGKFFEITMVEVKVGEKSFFKPMIIEKGDISKGKIGDVVIILRQNPKSKRWMVQTEFEEMFVSKTESKKIPRAKRSSIDNPEQAVDRKVSFVGFGNSNPARIGAPAPIALHFVILGWSPQLSEQMTDIYYFIQSSEDLMGQATLLKALQNMPKKIAREIFEQIVTA